LQELVVTGVAGSTPRVKLPFTVEKVDMEEQPVLALRIPGRQRRHQRPDEAGLELDHGSLPAHAPGGAGDQ
jgi:hypothetical protein